MSVITRVRALLERAGRLDTPEEEARTCALLAARAIARYDLRVVEVPPSATVSVPQASSASSYSYEDAVSDVDCFCVSCGLEIRVGARVARRLHEGVAHHRCRTFWADADAWDAEIAQADAEGRDPFAGGAL